MNRMRDTTYTHTFSNVYFSGFYLTLVKSLVCMYSKDKKNFKNKKQQEACCKKVAHWKYSGMAS